jgi:hypothetical protein
MGKKRKILYILLAILGMSLFYRMTTTPEEKRTPLKYKTGTKSVEKKTQPELVRYNKSHGSDEIPEIELSKLTYVKRRPLTDGINLFYPFFIKDAPPKPQPLPAPPPPPVPPVDPLEEELKLFRFMGFMEKREMAGRDKKVFLAKGQNIYIVKGGDAIEGKFKVTVMEKSIEISAINSEKKIVILIEEK